MLIISVRIGDTTHLDSRFMLLDFKKYTEQKKKGILNLILNYAFLI